jgi:hypothetical protein
MNRLELIKDTDSEYLIFSNNISLRHQPVVLLDSSGYVNTTI